jgi:predicted amidohydrolase YtcJ
MLFCLLACSGPEKANESGVAIDFLFTNGTIQINSTETIPSIGVHEGRFVTPTSSATQVIDLDGAVMVPGFHDSHTHLLAGSFVFDKLLLVGVSNMNTVKNKVEEYIATAPDVPWVVGYGWITSLMDNPSGVALDSVSNGYPIALFDSAGHSLMVNSIAMEMAGITADTPVPVGGEIERDENGNPTGILRESAVGLVSAMMVASFSDEQLVSNLQTTVETFHESGITSISEILAVPGVNLDKPELYAQEETKLRVHYYLPIFSADNLTNLEAHLDDQDPYLRFVGGKVWVDGSSGSGESWSLEESLLEEGHYGSHYFNTEELLPFIRHAEEHRYDLKLHVNGDAATQSALDALETIEAELGSLNSRYIFDHLLMVAPGDYGRMLALGITASIQPSHALVGLYGDQADHWGSERMEDAWDFARLENEGLQIAMGTDWPVWPTADAMVNYRTAVEGVLERSISREVGFDAYTINGVEAVGYELETGTIEVGKWADFVILSENHLESEDISNIDILETWIGGKKVFSK